MLEPLCGGGRRVVSEPYEFIRFGAMDVTKPYRFIGFGDIHGPRPYELVGFRWAFISQTPVVLRLAPEGPGGDIGEVDFN